MIFPIHISKSVSARDIFDTFLLFLNVFHVGSVVIVWLDETKRLLFVVASPSFSAFPVVRTHSMYYHCQRYNIEMTVICHICTVCFFGSWRFRTNIYFRNQTFILEFMLCVCVYNCPFVCVKKSLHCFTRRSIVDLFCNSVNPRWRLPWNEYYFTSQVDGIYINWNGNDTESSHRFCDDSIPSKDSSTESRATVLLHLEREESYKAWDSR